MCFILSVISFSFDNGLLGFLFLLLIPFIAWLRDKRLKQAVTKEKASRKCPHCQKEISSKADKCPYCQSELRSWHNRHPVLIGILVFLGFLVFLAIIGSGLSNQTPSQNNSTPTTQSLLDTCLSFAQKNYDNAWNKACKDQGKPATFKLPSTLAGVLDNRHTSDDNGCYQNYK